MKQTNLCPRCRWYGETHTGNKECILTHDMCVPDVSSSIATEHQASAMDTQIGGSHYKGMAIQPMEFSMRNHLDPCQHTAIKYIARFRQKGGIEDLEKAKHCIDMLIEFEVGNG